MPTADATVPHPAPSNAPAPVLTTLEGTGRKTSTASSVAMAEASVTGERVASSNRCVTAFDSSSKNRNGTITSASNAPASINQPNRRSLTRHDRILIRRMAHALGRVALIAALVSAPAAGAQQPASQPTQSTPPRFEAEVVVTPERGETPRALVPASTVVVDRERLAAIPAAHTSEIPAFLPGFMAARPQFHAGRPIVSARGFFGGGEAEYILLLIDGVPAADVESGLADWLLVPASSIRRVEAFRGPGASLYGDSAVGGVVQILTDRVDDTHGTITAGSFATV